MGLTGNFISILAISGKLLVTYMGQEEYFFWLLLFIIIIIISLSEVLDFGPT